MTTMDGKARYDLLNHLQIAVSALSKVHDLVEVIDPVDYQQLDPTSGATSEDLRKRMFAEMGELKITDREVAIELIGEILEKQLASRTELGPRDWARMIQAIRDWKIIESYTPARPA